MSSPSDKALTVRSVALGLFLTLLFAVFAQINDGLLHNTYLYSQHLPVGVFFVLVVLGVVVNPLLGRHRFRAKELMAVIAMLLVLGGVVAAGLNDYFPPIVAGPAKIMATSGEMDAFIDKSGEVQLPKGIYIGMPEHGRPDSNNSEYKYEIEGYHHGLGVQGASVGHRAMVTWSGADGVEHTQMGWVGGNGGDQVLDLDQGDGRLMIGLHAGAVIQGQSGPITLKSVTAPGIPWKTWGTALLVWAPMLLAAMVCFLCMAALVRHQWMNNERLTYPIAEVITNFLQDPEAGKRFAPVFGSRAFWVAFVVVAIVLLPNGLQSLHLFNFAIPTKIDLYQAFNFAPFNQGYAPAYMYLKPVIYFSIIGIVFFLPTDISLSVWLCFILGNTTYAVASMQGVPLDSSVPNKVTMGGWFVECLLILWIGRGYYLSLIRTAFGKTDDPYLREVRPFTWAFIASAVGMVVSMVALGAYWHHAIIAAMVYLGAGLVLARLVAEAGIPFIQMPMFCATVIFSITGLSAPMAALVPLTMLGQTLSADCREHVLPFAVNAEYLAGKAGIPRLQWGGIALFVTAIGTVISGAVILWCAYAHAGQQAIDGWWRPGPLMGSLGPIASFSQGGNPIDSSTTVMSYGAGAIITGGLGIARLAWSWWPIHPIGFLVCACYPTYKIWFSFFIGWMLKTLVMRYGGVQLYKKLKPAAMGLIASEAVIAGVFLILGLVAGLLDLHLKGKVLFLPE